MRASIASQSDAPSIADRMDFVFVDDPALEGASVAELQRRFQACARADKPARDGGVLPLSSLGWQERSAERPGHSLIQHKSMWHSFLFPCWSNSTAPHGPPCVFVFPDRSCWCREVSVSRAHQIVSLPQKASPPPPLYKTGDNQQETAGKSKPKNYGFGKPEIHCRG